MTCFCSNADIECGLRRRRETRCLDFEVWMLTVEPELQ